MGMSSRSSSSSRRRGGSARRHARGERYRHVGDDAPAGGDEAGARPHGEERGEASIGGRRHRRGASEPDPRRMYRDRRRGVLAGVCAGIADYFDFSLTGTRVATVLLAVPLFPWIPLGYVTLALVLPPRPQEPLYRDDDEEAFWRSVRASPIATLSRVRHKYRELEARMQRLERYVTSRHYGLDRDFRDLER